MISLIVADESVDFAVVSALRAADFEVRAIVHENPGWPDDQVLAFAFQENAYLITEDKDFGELTYRLKKPNHGILLIRLPHLLGQGKASLVMEALSRHESQLTNAFSVLDATGLRIKDYQ